MSAAIRPFTIAVSDDVLADLKARLRNTRWPEAELAPDWNQGVPLAWMQDVCRYWAQTYDWRARERALNRFAQFTTAIDDLDIHFLHVRSPHADAMPLIITHGWPGSFVEFHKVIEPLTIRRHMVAKRLMLFTSSARRCPASPSRASPRAPAGASGASRRPGPV